MGPAMSALTPGNLAHMADLPGGWHGLYRELLEALPPLEVSYNKVRNRR